MGLTLYHYIIIWKLVQLYCLNSGGNYAPGRTGLHLEQPSHPAELGSAEDFPLWQNWQKRRNQGNFAANFWGRWYFSFMKLIHITMQSTYIDAKNKQGEICATLLWCGLAIWTLWCGCGCWQLAHIYKYLNKTEADSSNVWFVLNLALNAHIRCANPQSLKKKI